jgi:fucose 4-O-acetylase-like acetyltransferase
MPPVAESGRAPAARGRDAGIDSLRGILILLVVIGHFPSRVFANPDVARMFGEVASYIYLFHIPAFFALSGILSTKPKSLRSLLMAQVPLFTAFLFWSLLSRWELLRAGDLKGVAMLVFFGNWHTVQGVTWFLPALISTRLLVGVWLWARPWGKSTLLLASAAIVATHAFWASVNDWIPYGLTIAFYFLPVVAAGRVLHQRLKNSGPTLVKIIAACLFLSASISLYRLEPLQTFGGFTHRVDLAQFNVCDDILNYLLLAVMIVSLVAYFSKARGDEVTRTIGLFGMPIFLLHPKILTVLTSKIPHVHMLTGAIGALVLSVVISIMIAIAVSLVFSRALPRLSRYLGMTPQGDGGIISRWIS